MGKQVRTVTVRMDMRHRETVANVIQQGVKDPRGQRMPQEGPMAALRVARILELLRHEEIDDHKENIQQMALDAIKKNKIFRQTREIRGGNEDDFSFKVSQYNFVKKALKDGAITGSFIDYNDTCDLFGVEPEDDDSDVDEYIEGEEPKEVKSEEEEEEKTEE